jgi:cytochrome d ubiquinol oxidase subunit II
LHETAEPDLRAAFRSRARAALLAVTLLAWAALFLAHSGAPRLAMSLLRSPWALGLQLATAFAGLGVFFALGARQDSWARALGITMTALLLAGWGAAQFPLLIVPDVSLRMAAAPPQVLRVLLWTLAGGAALLFPALFYLFAVFKGAAAQPKP